MKKIISFLLILLSLFLVSQFVDFGVVGKSVAETRSVIRENGSMEVYFCPRDNCDQRLVDFIDSAEHSLDCALYDLGLENVKEALLNKQQQLEVRVVMDNDYLHKFNHSFVKVDSWGLMHNKFCVADKERVFMGSFNPTDNGAFKKWDPLESTCRHASLSIL